MVILLQQKNFGPNVVYYARRAQSQIKKCQIINFIFGHFRNVPKIKIKFEIIYFALREQREGANSEIKQRRKFKKTHNMVMIINTYYDYSGWYVNN